MTFFDPEKTLIADTECYGNLWCIGLRRVSDGKTLVMTNCSNDNCQGVTFSGVTPFSGDLQCTL